MPKAKKNAGLLHPIDTIMHWYAEAQTIPAQLKKNFESEKKQAVQSIQELKNKLQKSKKNQISFRSMQAGAAKKVKQKSTAAARSLLKKYQKNYQTSLDEVKELTKQLASAKTQLKHTQVKEKYLRALQGAFTTVTKLFTKKHESSLKKSSAKKSKRRIHR